jgi:predicted kinase
MRDDRRGSLDARADDTSTDARRPEAVDRPGPTRSPDPLRQRLDQLPPGHPSSPYETEDHRRQREPLRDLDGGKESTARIDRADHKYKVTDAEWAEHVAEVREILTSDEVVNQATDRQHTTDPDRQQWTAARDRIHGELVSDLYGRAKEVPNDGQAIIAGGLGGAGKSTVLSKFAGIDLSKYLVINPDDIKEEMAKHDLIPRIEGLSPMEASDLVHEESSAIAKQLARKALTDGKNVIWDITMSSRGSTDRRISDLREAGYTVDGIFVDIPVETSVRRADARHREGHDEYCSGKGLGGRYVPPEVIRAQADPTWGSKNRKTFGEVSDRFDRWCRYDNSVDGRSPELVETSPSWNVTREEKGQ